MKTILLWSGWIFIILSTSCSVDNARNHYVLAEKLWSDKNYAASVSEFEKVISKDPRGKLGLQAMYRAGVTQSLYLMQYNEAIQKFQNYIQGSSDVVSTWDAQLQMGEILFLKTENYERALNHYRALLAQKPDAKEAPQFLFRIAKSQFYLFQFVDAVATYTEIIKKYSSQPSNTYWAEKAMYEIGATYLTQGEQGTESRLSGTDAYQGAMDAFKKFIAHYPNSSFVSEARFGIACCLEELNQLDEAYHSFEALKSIYPAPRVIEIKLIRIRERLAQRKRSR